MTKSKDMPLVIVVDRDESIHTLFLAQLERLIGEKAKDIVIFASNGVDACKFFQKNISTIKLVLISGRIYYKSSTMSWRVKTDETLGAVEFMAHLKRPCNRVPSDIKIISISSTHSKQLLQLGCQEAIEKCEAVEYTAKYLKQKGLA